MINIYNIDGSILMQAELTSAAKREEEMSKSDYISLSWSDVNKVILPVGAYILHTYKIDKIREVTRKFLLLEAYEPTQTNEQAWKYTPEFQHPKMLLGKIPFYILTQNSQNETIKQYVWSFVGVTASLGQKLCNFLNNDIKFGNCGWVCIISDTISNSISVSFSDNDFLSALSAITNAIGDNCEWHIDYDNETIYIGKIAIGDTPIELEVGKNIGKVSISQASEDYYNSFAVYGGTRNIFQVNAKGENISSSDIRLQLNEGSGTFIVDGEEKSYTIDKYSTIDLRQSKNEQQLTTVLDFDDIYPSLNTYVYNVRGREKYVIDSNATGSDKRTPLTYNSDGSVATYKTFTVWYMRLAYPSTVKKESEKLINTTVDEDGTTYYWYDMLITDKMKINGKNLACSFEANYNTSALSTPLAGKGDNGDYVGFELIFHESDSVSHSSDDVSEENFQILAGDYEIVYQEDSGVYLPSNQKELLIPKGEDLPSHKCNITLLYNFAITGTYTISFAKMVSIFIWDTGKPIKQKLSITLDIPCNDSFFSIGSSEYGYYVKLRADTLTISGSATALSVEGKDYTRITVTEGVYNETFDSIRNFYTEARGCERLFFESGIYEDNLPTENKEIYKIDAYDTYYKSAQQKLLETAEEEIIRLMSNLDNYSFNVYPQVFAVNNPLLKIGQRVIFNDGNGYTLDTRVLKLSTNLDFTYVQNVTVGNQAIKGTLTQLKEDVQTIVASGGSGGSGGGYSVAQFKNLIQRYGINYFLSKVDDDTASGNITFEKNVEVDENLSVKGMVKFGSDYSISSDGSAVLGDTTAKDVTLSSITSKDYAKELFKGFSLAPGANGSYKLEVGDLDVWGKASFAQLEIRKVSYAGGTVVYSNAGSTLKRVANVTDADGNVIAYKCWAVADDGTTQTMNWWTVGMMALCQTFNVQDGTNADQAANHYYWRLVIGKGQETLEDGKLYDYILLSNKKTFTGSDAIVPVYTDKCWAEENSRVIIFGSVAVAQCDRAMGTMADGCDVSTDDGGTAVSSRTFYGYAEGSDAPQADDVIVQVGDQVSWLSKGNLVMITTYNLNAKGNVPSISMYHSLGNLYAGSDGTANPYQWKTLTHLFSPKKTLVNSECFQFFTDTEDNVVSPITTTYDIVPSSTCITKSSDGTSAMPDDITLSLLKHYGDTVVEDMDTTITLSAKTSDETMTATYSNSVVYSFKSKGYSIDDLTSLTSLSAYVMRGSTKVASLDIPVLSDGANGTSVTIKGSLKSTDQLPTSGQINGDGYLIDGYLWVYTGSTASSAVHGFENVGQIKGDPGQSATQYYTYAAWMKTKDNSDGSFTTSNPSGAEYPYVGICVSTATTAPTDYKTYSWMYLKGTQGNPGTDALDIVITGSPLVFDTNDNGIVTDLSKTATIQAFKKGVNVTTGCSIASTSATNCTASVTGGGTSAISVKLTKISTQTVSGYTMSQQAGMVDVTLTYASVAYHAQIPFQVNVVKMMGSFKADSESLKSQYTEVSNQTTANTEELKNKANTTDVATELTELESTLTQTARQISLSVSEKAIGRRNMLVGSAARAYGEGWAWMNGGGSYGEQICEQIDTENGVDGTHALHCYSVKTGTDNYINAGFHWVGGAPQGNIKVEKGKSYTISFYAKATDLEKVCFVLEAIYEGSATDSSRPAGYAGPTGFSEPFSVDNNNTWQLITKTISVPSDAAYEYLEICLFVRAKADTTGLHDGWLCRPMMEEGTVYNGWTQSTGDSDYLTSSDMKRAGIDIDSDSVTLYGNQVKVKNGDTTAALFTDGRISGDYLNVSTIVSVGSDGSKVVIANGLISIYGTKNPTIPQIKFGVDSDGNAIMNYYDDSGLLLYGLGPDGMSSLDVETGSLTAVTFLPAGSLNFTPSGTATVFKSTLGTISETYNVVDSDTDNKLFRTHVSQKLSAWNKTVTLYKYRAPRVNGKIISDSGTGRPTTAALAEAADGCYFTSNLLICQNGALVNLASDGTYYSDAVPSDRNGKSIGTLKQYEVYDSPRYLIVLYGTKLISGAPSSAASVGQILASRDTYQQVGTGFDPVIDAGTVSGSDTLVASDDSE